MNIKSPCLKCDNRNVGCHCECEKYIEYKKKLKIQSDTMYQSKSEHVIYTKTRRRMNEK